MSYTGQHRLITPDEIDEYVDAALRVNLDEKVQNALQEQSWYRKYANTINTTIGAAVTLASSFTASGLELPPWAVTTIAVVGAAGTILGVKKTSNGLPSDTAQRLS